MIPAPGGRRQLAVLSIGLLACIHVALAWGPCASAAPALSPRDQGPWSPGNFDKADPKLPTLVIASDSTAATGNATARGWGAVLIDYFDPAKVNIANCAVGGRSFRTFTGEGRWDKIVENLKPGDFVVIEFGHNDGGGAKAPKSRGDVPGVGDDTETVEKADGTSEVVHSFGWYARKYARDAKAKGATPILSTTTVRNIWKDGGVERGMGKMLEWLKQVADEEHVLFLDHSNISADEYEKLGEEAATALHPQDHTHTSTTGAILNAEGFIAGLKTLDGQPLVGFLNEKGQAIAPHPHGPKWRGYEAATGKSGDAASSEAPATAPDPPGTETSGSNTTSGDTTPPPATQVPGSLDAPFGLNRRGKPLKYPPGVEPGMQHPEYNASLPTLWLIGDSTVKEGRDNGVDGGRFGWGHAVGQYFDLKRINVENQALGGTSSRSFRTGGWWEQVVEMVKPGDFVMMQFGHNDGGGGSQNRGSLRGAGDESEERVDGKGASETVHTYGWYMRQYVADVRKAGATPIVCSLIPRNTWKDGHVVRGQDDSFVLWAQQAAEKEGVPFINLNHIICGEMDAVGEGFAKAAFFRPDDSTHTNLLGAQFNARCVVRGVKALAPTLKLATFLSTAAEPVPATASENVVAAGTTAVAAAAASPTASSATSAAAPATGSIPPSGLQLASPFTHHMVLQRDLPLPVWGTVNAGSEVTVEFGGQSKTVKADATGKWRVDLEPLTASKESRSLTARVGEGESVTLNDVLVGEVWLCSGQSNMDFSVAKTKKFSFAGTTNEAEEVAAANHPLIRHFRGEWTKAYEPQERVAGEWQVCTPENVPEWSAVGYFFARDLQPEIDVPVGIVTLTFGASCSQAWIRREAIAANDQLKPLLDKFDETVKAYREKPAGEVAAGNGGGRERAPKDPVQDQHNPTVMYNGMIAPFVPFAIRGVLWYQGESITEPKSLFPLWNETLITDWRKLWGRELPFYFVQLAAQDKDSNSPRVRAWQEEALKLPATGMAVTIDIGDRTNVHPKNKQDVGKRLSLIALANVYGRQVEFSGPRFKSMSVEGSAARLSFDHLGGGLTAKDGAALACFEAAGEDGKFAAAEATIDGDAVVVKAAGVESPTAVRYAWANYPENPNLFNKAGLPAAPFLAETK